MTKKYQEYKITFQRENGTQGTDLEYATSKNNAIFKFNQVFRHGKYKILSCDIYNNNEIENSEVNIRLTLKEFNLLFECVIFSSQNEAEEKLRTKLLDCLNNEQYRYTVYK